MWPHGKRGRGYSSFVLLDQRDERCCVKAEGLPPSTPMGTKDPRWEGYVGVRLPESEFQTGILKLADRVVELNQGSAESMRARGSKLSMWQHGGDLASASRYSESRSTSDSHSPPHST